MRSFPRIVVWGLATLLTASPGFASPSPGDPPQSSGGKGQDIKASWSLGGGNMRLGKGARISVFDAIDGASGTSGDFQHQWTGGIRVEGDNGGWWRAGGEFAVTSVDSPVTLTNGYVTRQQTIHFMEGTISVLGIAQIPLPFVQPYAGLGPTLLITGTKENIGLSLGAQFVAGARLFFGKQVYVFAEARYQALAGRTYHFNTFGVQEGEFPTVTARVTGSFTALVFGGGIRLTAKPGHKKTS
jgi:hypothetical protein